MRNFLSPFARVKNLQIIFLNIFPPRRTKRGAYIINFLIFSGLRQKKLPLPHYISNFSFRDNFLTRASAFAAKDRLRNFFE